MNNKAKNYYLKDVILVMLIIILSFIFSEGGWEVSESGGGPSATNGSENTEPENYFDIPSTYYGESFIVIDYYFLDGTYVETHNIVAETQVEITHPQKGKTTGGKIFEENNPISLKIVTSPPPSPYEGEGLYDITSFAVVQAMEPPYTVFGGNKYWDLSVNKNNINGELVDTHLNEILPYKYINILRAFVGGINTSPVVSSRVINEGSVFNGNLSENSIHFTIEGSLHVDKVVDAYKPEFFIEVEANSMEWI